MSTPGRRIVGGPLALLILLSGACAAFGEDPQTIPPGVDASRQPDDGSAPSRYCATVDASYCEDFDGDEEPTGLQLERGGMLERDDAVSLSPPRSLLTTASENRAVARYRAVVDADRRVRLAFDVRIEQRGASGIAELASLDVELPSGRLYEVNVEVSAAGALSTQQYDTALSPNREIHPLAGELRDGVWTRVEMVLALDERKISITVDGKVGAELDMREGAPEAGTLRAGYGIVWLRELSAPTTWAVRYDNVTLDFD
jgi:hypothetical protein